MRTPLIGASVLVAAAVPAWLGLLPGNPPSARAQEAGAVFVDPQSLAGLSVGEMAQRLEPVMEYGKQAVQGGDFATAAACFDQVAAVLTDSYPRMDALLWAGIARSRGGNPLGAGVTYEQMVAVGKDLLVEDHTSKEPHVPLEVGSVESIRDLVRRGLIYQIGIFRDSGRTEEAVWTIRRLRAEEPEYHYLRKVLPIEAELLGLDAEGLNAHELQASRLSDQAKWAWGAGDAATAYRLADEVISGYPETGGALLARNLKSAMLRRHKRHDEARALYEEIISRLEPVAPTCDLVRNARCKLAWLDGAALIKSLVQRKRMRQATDPAEFERVRELFYTVMAWEREPQARIQAHEAWITSLYWQGDHHATVQACEEFLSQYADPKHLQPYGKEVAAVRVMAADALCELGRYGDALTHTLWLFEPDHPIPADNDVVRAGLQYRLCCLLLWTQAPREELDREVAILRSRFPNTSYVELMEGMVAGLEVAGDR